MMMMIIIIITIASLAAFWVVCCPSHLLTAVCPLLTVVLQAPSKAFDTMRSAEWELAPGTRCAVHSPSPPSLPCPP